MLNTIQTRTFRSWEDYNESASERGIEWKARQSFERELWAGREKFEVPGYCVVCRKRTNFRVDMTYSDGTMPNWREHMICSCGLNNRLRAAIHFLQVETGITKKTRIHATEQITPLADFIGRTYSNATFSEYLSDGTACGYKNARGVRHEDLCALSFARNSLELLLTFDVLEHIPNYRAACAEMARVIRPGGKLLATFPFDANNPSTAQRASISADGKLIHHLPPEYHGDPINENGCLCFQVFGWDILELLRDSGFNEATAVYYWSSEFGYLGSGQFMIIATK